MNLKHSRIKTNRSVLNLWE